MAKSLKQILGYDNLTGIVTSPEGGVPNVWPEQFFTIKKPITGNTAKWGIVSNSRRNASTVAYGSASRKRERRAIATKTAMCIHSFEHMDHDMETVLLARDTQNPNNAELGRQLIEAQAVEYRRQFDNLRVSAVNSMLRHGAIYTDGNGQLLPTSSGATQTIDLGIAANNKNQLNGIIAASWATAGTDILSHLSALQLQAVKNGRPLKYAYYGSAITGYLTGNTNVKELMKSDSVLTSALRQNKVPASFGIDGLEWRPLQTAYFEDANGTNQDWFPADFIVFLPEITPDIYQMQEGQALVPSDVGAIGSDAMAAERGMKTTHGMFSYAKQYEDPTGIRHWAGDTFLPVFLDPGSVFLADVVA